MSKDVQVSEAPKEEREVKQVFVSDGVYKYVYADTGEDVK